MSVMVRFALVALLSGCNAVAAIASDMTPLAVTAPQATGHAPAAYDRQVDVQAKQLVERGRRIFCCDTCGSEA